MFDVVYFHLPLEFTYLNKLLVSISMSNTHFKYEIRDPIYGFIHFNEWERKIINHPIFQRLRRIKQNSLTDMVYPGMTHTRFEHSIGVMKLADDMFHSIMNDERSITNLSEWGFHKNQLERPRQVIRIAALVHDVGHAPFSHASEEIMPKNKSNGNKYKHEDYTQELIEKGLKSVIEYTMENNAFRIKNDEISSYFDGYATPLTSLFWKVMINSQADADRGDYLQRDSYYGGVKYGIYDRERLINTLTVGIDPEVDTPVLGLKEEGWQVAESFIIARYRMFTQVYYHKTRRAYDKMLQEAILHTLGTLPSPTDLDDYLDLDDFKLWCLMRNDDSNEWFNALVCRNHIREIFTTDDFEKEEFEETVEKLEEENIWYWRDNLKKEWYNQDMDKEIMLFQKDGTPMVLSEKSKIINNMESFNMERIYVKLDDRE